MFSHWYSRLVSTAAALTFGAGVLFISGCGHDCNSCSDNEDVQPVNAGYETREVRYSNDVNTSSTTRSDVDRDRTYDRDADLRSDARARGTWNGDDANRDMTTRTETNRSDVETRSSNPVRSATDTAGSTAKGAVDTAGSAVKGATNTATNTVNSVTGH